ncbi:MAG TPA: protein kinase [Candidatus Limnocylindrales bacterium]|nr:protein kinase [Candidatus Limnocylindrales bacterium]
MSDGVDGGQWVDRLIDNRFRLLTPLGRGQTGQVWQAVDEQTGGPVAVKVYRGRPGQGSPVGVAHPHIVSIFFSGTYEGTAYTVMELVDGVSLATVLDEGLLPIDDAVNIVTGVCLALQAAHAAGVIHGNLKASNVLIAEQGVIKVGDFGGHGDPREDMYSLGLLMEAMAGRRDPVVERLLSRDPYTPTQLLSVLMGRPAEPTEPAAEDSDHERPRLVRLAVITGAVTLAVVIAACAFMFAPSDPPDLGSQAPPGSILSDPQSPPVDPSGSPSVSPSHSKPPAAPAAGTGGNAGNAAINAVKAVIAGQLRAGNIEPEAADLLDTKLDEIARFEARGLTKQANDRIDGLRTQLSTLRRSDRVTEDGYNAILAAVNKL